MAADHGVLLTLMHNDSVLNSCLDDPWTTAKLAIRVFFVAEPLINMLSMNM